MRAQPLRIEVSVATLLKIAAVAAGLYALYVLAPFLMLLLICLLLAMTLEPTVKWMGRHRISRPWGVGLLAIVTLGLFAALVGWLIPAIGREIGSAAEQLPSLMQKAQHWAASSPVLTRLLHELRQVPHQQNITHALSQPEPWALAAEAVVAVPVILVVSLYLVADGPRVYAWLLAYVPRDRRGRVGETAREVAGVVHAYVRGQAITSLLVGIFSFVTLHLLGVKAALALATLAALFDVIPLVGFIAFTVPAVLMALTVSPATALIVLVLYVGYHFIENYVIVPRVYGRQLRLSTLTVILALGAASAVAGVLGAVLVLPLVAALPIIERHWLQKAIGREAIEDHEALDRSLDEKDPSAIRRVIEGDEHPNTH